MLDECVYVSKLQPNVLHFNQRLQFSIAFQNSDIVMIYDMNEVPVDRL